MDLTKIQMDISKADKVKILFKKDRSSVSLEIISGKKNIETQYQAQIEHLEDEYFVTIPAFGISLSTRKEQNIQQHIEESVHSFFSYQLDKLGLESFIITMVELGFEIKAVPAKEKLRLPKFSTRPKSQLMTAKLVLA